MYRMGRVKVPFPSEVFAEYVERNHCLLKSN